MIDVNIRTMENTTENTAKILLMGTTGRVGGATLRVLAKTAAPGSLRVLTRRPEALPADLSSLVDVVGGEITDEETLERALDNIDTLLLVMGDHPAMAKQEIRLIDAAVRKGGIRIVKISAITAGFTNRVSFGHLHGEVEDRLIASGLPYVILRPTFFFQSLELFIDPIRKGFLPASTKDGAIGFVDLQDVAAAAARALTDPTLDGTIHILTGPRTLTMGEVTAALGVRHISPPQFMMKSLLRIGAGMDKWMAGLVSELMKCCAQGGEDIVTDAVATLTGRAPSDLTDYLARNKGIFSS